MIDTGKVLECIKGIYTVVNSPFSGEEEVSLFDNKTVPGRWIWDSGNMATKIYQTPDSRFFLALGGEIESKVLPAVVLRIALEDSKGLVIRRYYHNMTSSFENLEQGFQRIIEMLEFSLEEGWSVLEFDSQNLDSSNLPGIIAKTNWPYDELGHDWLVIAGRPKSWISLETFEGVDRKWYKPVYISGGPYSMSALRFRFSPEDVKAKTE